MTQGRAGFPFGIGCTDPRSQKRDLGHPSIVSEDARVGPTATKGRVFVDVGYCMTGTAGSLFIAPGTSVHDPAAVNVEGLAGHGIA
jgi:hypothetical protein